MTGDSPLSLALSLKGRGDKAAFTLAEVLITLGIIGIVAALTMPSLIAKHQEKQTVVKLKKFSSVMSQALNLAIQQEGEISSWGVGNTQFNNTDDEEVADYNYNNSNKLFNMLAKYIKHVKYCPNGSNCETYSRRSLDGTAFGDVNTLFVLNDGVVINWINVYDVNCNAVRGTSSVLQNICGEIFVDINGNKSPNSVGKDIFLFYYNKYGNIIPKGTAGEAFANFQTQCNLKNKSMYNGYGCAAWVIYNENMDYLHCEDLSWNGKNKCD